MHKGLKVDDLSSGIEATKRTTLYPEEGLQVYEAELCLDLDDTTKKEAVIATILLPKFEFTF